ncbi:multidrug efflux SMR transporter [Clostridium sp. Ade.TY]|uniref:DMT family transporter n=1 Tax=Clostridium sp. Ade.TY TaxID=1391647 RepID=UPI00040709AC|nr:multidrug efflux SMR transporter [Clostridium sp. Ade.TY]
MNKAWTYVVVGGLLEVFWALCLKKSNGFTNLGYTIVTIILVIISFCLFSKGMTLLPSGIAYTVFTGIGAIGTIVFGILILGESISLKKIIFSCLLLIGIIGLKINSKEEV